MGQSGLVRTLEFVGNYQPRKTKSEEEITSMDTLEARLPITELGGFCRRHPIQELWVFGSVLADWKPESDVDLLVRFLPGESPDLDHFWAMEDELTALIGRKVDFIPADSVENPFVKAHIRKTRVQLYAA